MKARATPGSRLRLGRGTRADRSQVGGTGPLRRIGPALASCLAGRATVPAASCRAWMDEAADIITCNLGPSALALLLRDPGADDVAVRLFREAAFRSNARSVVAVETAAPALRVLRRSKIDFAVIKGPAAASHYGSRTDRPFTDLDVIVEATSFRRAHSLLVEAGYGAGEVHQPWDWFERLCMEGINLHSRAGGNLDLHHHISPWIFGRHITLKEILDQATSGTIDDELVPFAGLAHSLAISAVHIINDLWKGAPSFLPWKDLIVFAQRLGPSGASAALKSAGLSWFEPYIGEEVRAMLKLEVFDRESPTATPGAISLDRRLEASGWSGPTRVSRHKLGWAARLPVPNALAFLAGSALPSPTYVKGLHTTYRDYWKRSWTDLRYRQ